MVQKLNVAQKEAGEITVLPAGSYVLEIMKVTESQSKNSGNPTMGLDLRVVGGPCDNMSFKFWIPKIASTAWRVQQLFDAADPNETIHQKLDYGQKDGEGNPIYELSWENDTDLEGLSFIAECAPKTYEGKRSTNIINMSAIPQAAPQQTAAPVQPQAQAAPVYAPPAAPVAAQAAPAAGRRPVPARS